MHKAIAQVRQCECGRWKGLTLPSIYSSHWSPRLVTILGVPSSTGRISTWNCWGAAVIICGGSQKGQWIFHRHLKHVRSRTYKARIPEISWHFRMGNWASFHHLSPLGMRLKGECWLIKWEQYEKKRKKQVALLLEFHLLWNLTFTHLHIF